MVELLIAHHAVDVFDDNEEDEDDEYDDEDDDNDDGDDDDGGGGGGENEHEDEDKGDDGSVEPNVLLDIFWLFRQQTCERLIAICIILIGVGSGTVFVYMLSLFFSVFYFMVKLCILIDRLVCTFSLCIAPFLF